MTKRSYLLAVTVLVTCDDSIGPPPAPPLPTSLQSTVNNPFFPLPLGRTKIFHRQTPGGLEVDSVTVFFLQKTVNGFATTEVHDRRYVAGSLTEDTFEWFAQDGDRNVWYLGKETTQYHQGVPVSTAGTWQWGVHGALPGIIMWGDPSSSMNTLYRQGFDRGNTQDVGKIVALNETVTVPYGTLTGCIKTEEWSTLESAPHANKYYCPQVGAALEVLSGDRTELVTVGP